MSRIIVVFITSRQVWIGAMRNQGDSSASPPVVYPQKTWSYLKGTRTKIRNGEMEITGEQWPVVLYAECHYDPDEPWVGFVCGQLLLLAFKHIFVALSSVYPNTKSYITHSGNVKLHGMMNITPGSLACTATQVWFALSAQSMFLRSHTVTDLEGFYNSILDLLKDLDEIEEVNALLAWWNWRKIIPAIDTPWQTGSQE
ncbi:hypothetical protein SERLA73DRAFT_148918 [Serpula lacrymans var. lacrymans S7.3]|uniref:Uncharacterized protein n=1 Tax=Serpula lacrymans var. lacrymans (strain S7.3) TaxID=936435 RepID=F8PGP3_SERL3|nr:hypothetical protein SERLA73DRAFT_148918 [Serpula lacrymans var. lacrymans S7.3]